MTLKKEKRKKNRSIYASEQWQLYSLCAIPILLVIVFCYLPLCGIVIAFKDYKYNTGIFGSRWVGFDNFRFFFESKDFGNIIKNTLSMNAIFIIVGTVAALVAAMLLYEVKSRATVKAFQTVMISPYFISWVVAAYMVFSLLNTEYGIVNRMLEKFGLSPVDWYSTPNAWPPILTLAVVWKNIGMDSVLYYAALMGISSELFEAAEIDGANKLKQIWYISLPELRNLLVILIIIKIGNIFRADFGLFYQLPLNVGTLYSTTDVMDTYIFRTMRVVGNMGMSSAAGLLQSVIGLILVVITNHVAKKIDPDTGLF